MNRHLGHTASSLPHKRVDKDTKLGYILRLGPDPGSSDSPDHSGFTTVRRRRAAKGSKPEAACLTQTPDGSTYYRLTPASRKPKKANVAEATPSVKSTRSICDSPVSWRKPPQPAAAPQGAVGDGRVQAAAPAAVKNNR
ncbi:hypothetical protein EVAR_87956_1 [Eumeta japonica]|uniref:Uncharacterized protein n=1 Tax=Eumeta variegata TaxID=151549 RepID=A0A4C1VDM7_EUMVA|nr:hypothetical protein EVAR_87956_1 [Eumeta japonica]